MLGINVVSFINGYRDNFCPKGGLCHVNLCNTFDFTLRTISVILEKSTNAT